MSESAPKLPGNGSVPRREREKGGKSWRSWSLYLLFLVGFTWCYMFLGSGVILRPSTAAVENLQRPYLEAVYRNAAALRKSSEEGPTLSSRVTSLLPWQVDGVVEPLWPWLFRGWADEPPDVLLEKGRWANLYLCCGLLVLLGVGAARAFSFTGAAAMLMVGGFGIILERSAYFTPDALYNLLILLAWLCSLSLIRQNQLWLYASLGVLLGLIYLTRPPVWPLVGAFLIVSLVRTVAEWFRRGKDTDDASPWTNSNQLVGFAMLVTAFILVTGSRLGSASSTFGYPFHSYAGVAVWMESADEAIRFHQQLADAGEEARPAWAERPGLFRFVRDNGIAATRERAVTGAREQIANSVIARQGGIILYSFFVFLVIALIHRWTVWRQKEEIWKVRGTSARWMLFFLAAGVSLNLLLVGIGNRVTPNNVMTTAIFLPMLMTFIWIAERYRRQLQRTSLSGVVNLAYCGLMVLPILWITFRVLKSVHTALQA